MEKLTVIVSEFKSTFSGNIEVNSRVYDSKGEPVMTKKQEGYEGYHMGQISSSLGWAEHDIPNHNKERLDVLYPKGWEIVEFKVIPYTRNLIIKEVLLVLTEEEIKSPSPIEIRFHVHSEIDPKNEDGVTYTISYPKT